MAPAFACVGGRGGALVVYYLAMDLDAQLYVVATPLGNLGDASPRVREALAAAPVIACEDTRRTWQLLSALGIPRPELFSYRQGNEEGVSRRIAGLVRAGTPVALCSDGGYPGISDPGYRVLRVFAEEGLPWTVLPGPCSVELALLRAGLKGGFAFDLGGGSCQVFRFCEEGLREGASLPFGCLTLGEHFVRRGLFPDREEARGMRRYVRGTLEEYLPGFAGVRPSVLHAMGGTARAVAKVLRATGQAEQDGECLCVPREALRQMLRDARKCEGKMVATLRRVIPGRMSTLLPGVLAMEAIARHLGCETIEVTPTGVREGFLWTRLLPTAAPSTAN